MKTKIRVLTVSLGLALGLFGVASGFAQTVAPPVTPAKPTMPAKPAMADSKAAAGGGPGKVWVNASSKTYHCEGTKFYGKTKTGEYATEAEAKAKGNRAAKGKGCAI